MTTNTFEIAYEGPAVDAGIMDVRELAPALLAFGSLIEAANRVIGTPDTPINVVVKSNFEKGSFKIVLELIQSLSNQLLMMFDAQGAKDPVRNIIWGIGFVSTSGISLIALLKLIKQRPIKRATVIENGNIRLEFDGENGSFDSVEVKENVVRLFRDRSVRENLSNILIPLEREGINGFSVREGQQKIQTISKDEVIYYNVPEEPIQEQTTVSTRRVLVNLIEVAFEDGLKWRFSDGENKFYASMADDSFIIELNSGRQFAKGDVLEIELETTQIASKKNIKNEHKVLKVINHMSQPRQIEIPFDDAKE